MVVVTKKPVSVEDLNRVIAAVAKKSPEDMRDYYVQLREDDPAAARILRHELLLPVYAREDKGRVGLQAFYELILGKVPPRHVKGWIIQRDIAREEGRRGIMIKAFRGATKSTLQSFIALLFDIGHNPYGSTLLIRIKDEVGHKSTANMAKIISGSPDWKKVFPNVIPHEGGGIGKSGGWGAKGYEVRLDNMSIAAFDTKKLRDTLDPSFLGVGIKSGEIIGKHPTVNLSVDDIHNRDNTESRTELEATKDRFIADVFPTIVPKKTFVSWSYTPWVEHDAYALAENTMQYNKVVTPAYVELPDHEKGVSYEGEFLTIKNARITWPEVYPPEELEIKLLESQEKDFARMYLLDLEKAKGIFLKREWINDFPHEDILKTFPVVFGVDYASVKERHAPEDFNYFAVSIGVKLPSGGVVLVDGLRAKLGQAEAEQKLMAMATVWRPKMIGIEDEGSGSEFIKILRRNTNLPIMPFGTRGLGKAHRFEIEMAPLFQFNRAYVSSVHTAFIMLFLSAWISWDRTETTPDDELDSTYYMLRAAADKLMGGYVPAGSELPSLDPPDDRGIATIGQEPSYGRK